MKGRSQIDWMGKWYEILRERGENDLPSLGRLDLKSGEIDWYRFSHAKMDGIGAITRYYQQLGITLATLPQIRESAPPTLWERLQIIYRLLFKSKRLRTQWKESFPEAQPSDPLALHWHIFSPSQLREMEAYCRNSGFSLNAYVMNRVSKVLLKELSVNEEGTWTLPVNLRPLVSLNDFHANHSSGILININRDDSPRETQREIGRKLKLKEHWGIWWAHQVGRLVGMKGMRYISRQNAKKSFLLGSFSILGSWELPPDHIWLGSAPGSRNFPLSAYLMKANHHLSFCLKIHPSILRGELRAQHLFKQVIEALLAP